MMAAGKFDYEGFECLGETEGETQINLFLRRYEKGEPQRSETMQFMVDAFRKIQAGEDPKKALKLLKKRGKKRTYEDMILEACYAEAILRATKETELKLNEVIDMMATIFCKSRGRMEEIYYANKKHAEHKLAEREFIGFLYRFSQALPEEVRKAIGHWPAGNVHQAALLWEANPDLSAEEAIKRYYDALTNTPD